MSKLGIVAGAGSLPGQMISACRQAGRDFHVLAFEGSADRTQLGNAPVDWIRVESLTSALNIARRRDISELVLAGGIPRPSPAQLMRDPRSAGLMLRLGARMRGDDDLLSAVVEYLEEKEGFHVVAPEELQKELLAIEGCYGVEEPDAVCRRDIETGVALAQVIGAFDMGQAVIVQKGRALGVEGAEGTDRLLQRCAEFIHRDESGGVLVKLSKPGQERRVDLPAIGVQTVEQASLVGLKGLAVEAGGALILDRHSVTQLANRQGVFVVGISRSYQAKDAATG